MNDKEYIERLENESHMAKVTIHRLDEVRDKQARELTRLQGEIADLKLQISNANDAHIVEVQRMKNQILSLSAEAGALRDRLKVCQDQLMFYLSAEEKAYAELAQTTCSRRLGCPASAHDEGCLEAGIQRSMEAMERDRTWKAQTAVAMTYTGGDGPAWAGPRPERRKPDGTASYWDGLERRKPVAPVKIVLDIQPGDEEISEGLRGQLLVEGLREQLLEQPLPPIPYRRIDVDWRGKK